MSNISPYAYCPTITDAILAAQRRDQAERAATKKWWAEQPSRIAQRLGLSQ